MNEVQRQAYLEAMGIDSWFPRYVLPGAAPSRPCEWPAELLPPARTTPPASTPVPPPPAEGEAPRPGPASPARPTRPTRPAGEAWREPPAPARKAADPAPAPPAPRTAAATEPPSAVRFHLAFMRCGAIAVLNQLPLLGRERLGAAQRQLFLNLVKALGLSPDVRIQEESFRWPFAEAMLMDAGAEAARQSLRAYVDEQAGGKPFRALLVLGEQLTPFVLPPEAAGEAEPGRLLRLDGVPWPVLLSRSLDEMLSLPPLKRQVWRDLAALSALSADA